MKFLAALILLVAAVSAQDGPTKISSNNVGDIITVDVNAKANISNQIDANIISVLLAYLNAQAILIGNGNGGGGNNPGLPNWPPNPPSPPNWPPNPPGPPNWPPNPPGLPTLPTLPPPTFPTWPTAPNPPNPTLPTNFPSPTPPEIPTPPPIFQ